MTLGEKIRYNRMRLGLSQDDLADILGVSRYTVLQWEADRTVPSLAVWPSLSETLDIPIEDLIQAREGQKEGG